MDLKLKYIEWKQKSATNRVYPGVELISFHLPKTGGVSFRNVLKRKYAKDLLLIYSRGILKNINNQKPIWVPENTKALHGHFQPHLGMKEQFPNAKWVVWFREPKQRVISHYNYWKSNEQKNEAYKYFIKNIGSFKEFVLSNELRKQVCMQETFLRKVELSNFDFVGDLENYESDIIRFGQEFDIEIPKQKRLNQSEKSQKESYQFTPEMLKVIAGEIDIYNQIKDLNKV